MYLSFGGIGSGCCPVVCWVCRWALIPLPLLVPVLVLFPDKRLLLSFLEVCGVFMPEAYGVDEWEGKRRGGGPSPIPILFPVPVLVLISALAPAPALVPV